MWKSGWIVAVLVVLAGVVTAAARPAEDHEALSQIRGAIFRDAHPRVYKSHQFAAATCDFGEHCDKKEADYVARMKAYELKKDREKAEADVKDGYMMSLDRKFFENWADLHREALGEERLQEIRKMRELAGK